MTNNLNIVWLRTRIISINPEFNGGKRKLTRPTVWFDKEKITAFPLRRLAGRVWFPSQIIDHNISNEFKIHVKRKFLNSLYVLKIDLK